jgi:hypothetical protein
MAWMDSGLMLTPVRPCVRHRRPLCDWATITSPQPAAVGVCFLLAVAGTSRGAVASAGAAGELELGGGQAARTVATASLRAVVGSAGPVTARQAMNWSGRTRTAPSSSASRSPPQVPSTSW